MDLKEYQKAMIASMKSRTGKTLEEWVDIVRKDPLPDKRRAQQQYLKEKYGLGQNSAILILQSLNGGASEYDDGDKLVNEQFQGDNAPLKSLYEWLAEEIKKLGEDVTIQPRKTYIPFYRKKQFLVVKPQKGKLHIGLALPETMEFARLDSAKGLGSERITRQVVIAQKSDATQDVREWIRKAYEMS